MLRPLDYYRRRFLEKGTKKAHDVNRELCGVGGN